MAFNVGDVVHLKSGGPNMTVIEIEGDQVSVTWSEKGKVQRNTFPAAALMEFDPSKMGPFVL